ncbi:MAG: LysM peptidoglycan-binding domain-containing protein [Clostridia bacterium]|nr:LysM peptidoglycan-binding domain-containing protein [Clostridia bacterium]
MGLSAIVNITYSRNDTSYKTIYVTQGDTLWTIATHEKEKNSYYEDDDIRDIIYDIKSINNLSVCDLKVGQKLKIPVKAH